MTAAPIPPRTAAVPALFNAGVPRAIHDALIDSEQAEFVQRYQEAMAHATQTMDLTEVLQVLDAYQEIARKTQEHGVEVHRRMLAHVDRALATGEAPAGSVSWDELRAKLDR